MLKSLTIFLKNRSNQGLLFLLFFNSYLLMCIISGNKDGRLLDTFSSFNLWLFLLIVIFLSYFCSHFFFPIKKIYEFIYRFRFFIATGLLLILVLGKFHGSSIAVWNHKIEPSFEIQNLNPIIGKERVIRSDEWLVNTPYSLAQFENYFSYYNSNIRGEKTDMFAGITAPTADIMIVTKPFLIGYLILGKEYGMSFYWYGRLICLFLVSFELLMILTKESKRASLLAAILITFSPAIFWWYSTYLVEILIGGQFALIQFYYFLKTDIKWKKVFFALLISLGCLIYAFTLYPAWMVPFAYVYLIIAIYFLFLTKNNHCWKLKNFSYLGISVLIVLFFVYRFFSLSGETIKIILNTVYPGSRFITGGTGYQGLFNYMHQIFFAYKDTINPCESSTFFSLFPFPILLSMYYLFTRIKEWKENIVLILLLFICLLFLLFSIFSFPSIFARGSLLYMVPVERLNIATAYVNILLLALVLDKISFPKGKIFISIIWMILSICVIYFGNKNLPTYLSLKWNIILLVLLWGVGFLIIFFEKKLVFHLTLIGLSFFMTLYINPLMQGLSGLYQKPLAKELQKYKKQDSKWISLESIEVPNYLGMMGLKVVNSTNLYPNLKLWESIDSDNKYKNIYNRYAHIQISLINNQTNFELIQPDYFKINLNKVDLCKMNIGYLTSPYSLENFNQEDVIIFEKLYQDSNIYIYKTWCEGVET